MPALLKLDRNSLGVGDRFARQAKAQLQACLLAEQQGEMIVPVWNKSHREHSIIGSEPSATRGAADAAVRELGWRHSWFVDADHIGMGTVDRFLPYADFFTIDVADWIGTAADAEAARQFISRHSNLIGPIDVPNIADPFVIVREDIERAIWKYLAAIQEAGRVYRHIASAKGTGGFVTEISMDETDSPQTPMELLVILAAVADERIPIQTIAPKFSGRFNKGVDYSGDLEKFEKEFCENVAVLSYAVRQFGLPETLKLSVHSGSDKFSIYEPMRRVLRKFKAGLHLKTAGTTWLEELIGLAESGGSGLALTKDIYGQAVGHIDDLCGPYSAVIAIDRAKLPTAMAVKGWNCDQYVSALRHDPRNPQFNPHVRQLLHIAYKNAAEMGPRYLGALEEHREIIERNVTENLFERHIKPLFLADK
jgi:tagaturonate epimerase